MGLCVVLTSVIYLHVSFADSSRVGGSEWITIYLKARLMMQPKPENLYVLQKKM